MGGRSLLDLPERERQRRLKAIGLTEEEYREQRSRRDAELDQYDDKHEPAIYSAGIPKRFTDVPVVEWQPLDTNDHDA